MANWRDDTPGAAAIARDQGTLLDTFSAHGDLQDILPYAAALGELAFFQGDLDEAWRRATVAWSPLHDGATSYDLVLLALAARVIGELRRADRPIPDDAIASIDAVFARATTWPIVSRWRALVDAELSGADGPGAEVATWAVAAETLMDESMPAHLGAYAWWRLGQAQLAVGDRVGAGRSLRNAEERADRIGTRWVSRRAHELLETAGLIDHGRGRQQALTSRERQVLDLVAEGLTNREISQRLFISGKTTSTHVSAILRKLGATTRTQAAVMAGQLN
jgi:DNA-binding CsgD family transcriptional regulator